MLVPILAKRRLYIATPPDYYCDSIAGPKQTVKNSSNATDQWYIKCAVPIKGTTEDISYILSPKKHKNV